MIPGSRNVLVCDADRDHGEALAVGLTELGYVVEVVTSHADAFGFACSYDLEALIVAPLLRDGSALVLPSALGIRRPPLVVLVTCMGDRLDTAAARRVGFDAQLTKVVRASAVDRLVRKATESRLSDPRTTAPWHLPR